MALSACGEESEGAGLVLQSVKIIDDSNGDGVLSPGERAGLRVTIKNEGTTSTGELEGTLTSTSPFIVELHESWKITFGIAPGHTFHVDSRLEIAPNTPPGTRLDFRVEAHENGNLHVLDFAVTVKESAASLSLESLQITDDSNSDGVLNPGERARLRMTLKNTGSSRVSWLHGSLTTESSYVTELQSKIEFPWMGPGGSQSNTSSLTISTSTPPGTVIPFVLFLTNEEGQPHTLSFSLTVFESAASLVVKSVEFINDSNGDGVLNPGERAGLKITLENAGSSRVSWLRGSLTTESPYVTELGSKIEYIWMNPGQSRDQGQNSLTIASDTPPGTVIPFVLALLDEEEQPHTLSFSVTVFKSAGHLAFKAVSLTMGGNEDGTLNPGESAHFDLTIENIGTSDVTWLDGSMTTESPFVESLTGTVKFFGVPAGKTATHPSNRISVLAHTPSGTVIPIQLSLRDAEDQPHELSFHLLVH